jgi:large subunit ribosomal protein L25
MVEQKKISLTAETRSVTGKKVKNLRNEGIIPAVVYGHKEKPESLSIKKIDFVKAYHEAGTSTLVNLKIDDSKSVKVLVHEPQLDPVRNEPVHVDFYRVSMDEKIKTEIPLEFIGESAAVANMDGALITNRDNVEVECLPADLVSFIEIDLSALGTFEDQITVADIKKPAGIEIITEPEAVIAFAEAPRSEEEMAELEESAEDQEKEAIEQIAGEDAEATEGETAKDDSENGKDKEIPEAESK